MLSVYDGCMLSHSVMDSDSLRPWTVAHQAPMSIGLSQQEYWSVLPLPFPGELSKPETEPMSSALTGRFFITEPAGKPQYMINLLKFNFCMSNNSTTKSVQFWL